MHKNETAVTLYISLMTQMKDITLEKEKNMAKSCINSIMLYTTEAYQIK